MGGFFFLLYIFHIPICTGAVILKSSLEEADWAVA